MGLPPVCPQLLEPQLDLQGFIDWEAQQGTKHEFVNGEVFAMVGARQDHVVVALTLAALLRAHLRGTRCRAYTSDMKLEVAAANAVFYPDVMVSCDEADRQRHQAAGEPQVLHLASVGLDLLNTDAFGDLDTVAAGAS